MPDGNAHREIDEQYMRRCLQLAANGIDHAKPNPMVGAVIVSADGRIIGEGYHVRCGEGHAEVNAFASVRPADEPLLSEATVYVSLEPCAHWGKTPPCADLIVHKGVRRVVCGCIDPFAEVQGRGVQRIRDAGIAVTPGVLEAECLALNRRFMTVNTLQRPYIILKWAQTDNGMIAAAQGRPLAISTPFTRLLVHRLRAESDAILIGRKTLETDRPQLTVRDWAGRDPDRIVLSRSAHIHAEGFRVFPTIDAVLQQLQAEHRQTLLVEGGAATLESFMARNLWDEIRIETAPFREPVGIAAPSLPATAHPVETLSFDGNIIRRYLADNRQNT